MSIEENDLEGLAGAAVIGSDGDKIGDVSQFYLSDTTGKPTWATVKTGLFGSKETFVPLAGSSVQPGELRVAFDNATVKDAPRVDADGHLTLEEEDGLYRYYGIADDEDSEIRGSDQSNERALDDTGAVGHDDRGTRDADDSRVGSGDDTTSGFAGTSPRRSDDDNRDNDGGGHVDRSHDVDLSSRDDRDADPDTVTPGETRTRMRRYVVTEHVTQTVEELPEGDNLD
jgi:hypothetical protein